MASFTPLLFCLLAILVACSGAAVPSKASSDLKAESSYGLGYGLGGYGGIYGHGYPGYWGYGHPYSQGLGYPGYGFGYGGHFGGYPYY